MPYIGTIKEAYYYTGNVRSGNNDKTLIVGATSLFYVLRRFTFYYDLAPSAASVAGGDISFDPPAVGDGRASGQLFTADEEAIETMFDMVEMGREIGTAQGQTKPINLEVRFFRQGRKQLVYKTFTPIIPCSPTSRALTEQKDVDDGLWEKNIFAFTIAMPPIAKISDHIKNVVEELD